ncbi:jg19107 [Pararge aegeria aegeria]|uniref:Jg19107 protein n=1 Tax=Pararge aegeria aegeria TaxID=348720 RepID=A0A8S4S5Q7_9NEOP|nr:jg19107 [Pararge aegeria aegeria]
MLLDAGISASTSIPWLIAVISNWVYGTSRLHLCSGNCELFIVRDNLTPDEIFLKELKKTDNTVVLYCHGNSNHRASPHRLQMYRVFQELNYHVIALDYRGYGDSTCMRPTEKGVVEDVLQVYSWLVGTVERRSDQRPPVVLWGHSLGTAIAANLVVNMAELCLQRKMEPLPLPNALILEAPFNNLVDAIESHPFSKLVSWLPYYKGSFVKPFTLSSEYTFATDQYLAKVPELPVLILHSKGDRIVPFDLAVKLYNSIKESRKNCKRAPTQLHVFDRGHNDLCEAPGLPRVVGLVYSIELRTYRTLVHPLLYELYKISKKAPRNVSRFPRLMLKV